MISLCTGLYVLFIFDAFKFQRARKAIFFDISILSGLILHETSMGYKESDTLKRIFSMSFFLSLLLVLNRLLSVISSYSERISGKPVPRVTLTNISGKPVSLNLTHISEKIILVHSDCSPDPLTSYLSLRFGDRIWWVRYEGSDRLRSFEEISMSVEKAYQHSLCSPLHAVVIVGSPFSACAFQFCAALIIRAGMHKSADGAIRTCSNRIFSVRPEKDLLTPSQVTQLRLLCEPAKIAKSTYILRRIEISRFRDQVGAFNATVLDVKSASVIGEALSDTGIIRSDGILISDDSYIVIEADGMTYGLYLHPFLQLQRVTGLRDSFRYSTEALDSISCSDPLGRVTLFCNGSEGGIPLQTVPMKRPELLFVNSLHKLD